MNSELIFYLGGSNKGEVNFCLGYAYVQKIIKMWIIVDVLTFHDESISCSDLTLFILIQEIY